jgi:hypothetical protein
MTNYIIILSLILIYVLSICTIFGSINIYARKTGAGKIKQAVLDFLYIRIGTYCTNFIGLALSGVLQTVPLWVVDCKYAFGGLLMPLCYTIAVKYLGDTKWAEYMHGFSYGLLMLAAVIGG